MSSRWFEDRVKSSLAQREELGLLRSAKVFSHLGPTMMNCDGRQVINFGANDYLGLRWQKQPCPVASNETLRHFKQSSADQFRGSGASPLVSGRTPEHANLELRLAEWKQFDAALTFSSGYSTNVSVIAAIAGKDDILFSDELNHASLIDGCLLSKAEKQIYSHARYEDLEKALKQATHQRNSLQGFWIISDTVFSMEGDLADIDILSQLARQYDAGLILDEAHAVGVYGQAGRGLVDPSTLQDIPLVCIGTCSKALGAIGGYVVSNAATIEYLRQFARGYIYSTSMPPGVARSITEAIQACCEMDAERIQLRENAVWLRQEIRSGGGTTTGFDSPIIPVYLQTPERALQASRHLLNAGFFVPAIRPPTVPLGSSLLRISLSCLHTRQQIEGLASALRANY